MTLVNKKANQNDRISDLPSNLIDAIMGNLKIREQVRTSILSKKWRYMWTSAPHLYFDNDFFKCFLHLDDPCPVFYKTITDVLVRHNGPIHKFSIRVYYDIEIDAEKLNMWIPFMSRDIKHLKLVTCCTPKDQMPDILFSCKELTYFKFVGFKYFSISPNFQGFTKLLELHLECDEVESSALESFMYGCPVLEKLSIEFRLGCDHLVISSPSLKVLMLGLKNTKSICLKKANNLMDFTLKSFHREISGLVTSLPQIKKFSVANWGKNPFADIIPRTLLTSSFSSLEYLQMDYFSLKDKRDILYFVSLLESAPRLIELVIKYYNDVDTTQVSYHLEELECHSCCLKLQTMDIHAAASSQGAMSLIRFILANSPLLETLTFYCSDIELDAHMLLNISKNLLRMERASPRAQVDFLHFT